MEKAAKVRETKRSLVFSSEIMNILIFKKIIATAKRHNLGLDMRTASYALSIEKIFKNIADAGFTM